MSYLSDLNKLIANYDRDAIYTMDEISICFDELGRKNFEFLDSKTNHFELDENESSSEKRMITIVITTLADGTLLPSLLICPRTSSFLCIKKHYNITLNLKEDGQEMDNQSMKKCIWDVLKSHSPGEKLLVLREAHAIYNKALELLLEISCKYVTIPRGFRSLLQPMEAWTYERPSVKKCLTELLSAEWTEWHQLQMSNSQEKFSEQVLIDLISRALLKLSNERDLIRNVCIFFACIILLPRGRIRVRTQIISLQNLELLPDVSSEYTSKSGSYI